MSLNTVGIVIREKTVKENDRIITVLTKDYGIIRATVYGAKKMQSRLSASTQLFAYSEFSFSQRKEFYSVDHAVNREMFFALRNDIESLALAQYFAQLEEEMASDDNRSEEFLRLILNSIHLLCSENKNAKKIKAVFEMRMLCLSGYMPDILMCENCGKYEDEVMYFNLADGTIRCRDCFNGNGRPISAGVLHAMRHICYSDHEKIFNFKLSDESLDALCKLTEDYLFLKVRRNFKTLDFYYSLI